MVVGCEKLCNVWTGIDFLEFRASEIGAAVALSVSGELHTLQFDKFSLCPHLDKVRKVHFIILTKLDVQCHNRYAYFIALCIVMSPV